MILHHQGAGCVAFLCRYVHGFLLCAQLRSCHSIAIPMRTEQAKCHRRALHCAPVTRRSCVEIVRRCATPEAIVLAFDLLALRLLFLTYAATTSRSLRTRGD